MAVNKSVLGRKNLQFLQQRLAHTPDHVRRMGGVCTSHYTTKPTKYDISLDYLFYSMLDLKHINIVLKYNILINF